MSKPRPIRHPAVVVLGVVMLACGLLFMFQGLGAVHGSPMTGSNFWAAAGPVIAIVGTVIALSGLRRPHDRHGRHEAHADE
jgi:hypothetical protein